MNEYSVSDYGIFTEGINTTKKMNDSIETNMTTIRETQAKLASEAVFMGPIANSCQTGFTGLESKIAVLTENFTSIMNYLMSASSTYKAGDDSSLKTILSIGNDGKITAKEGGSAGISNTGNKNQDAVYNYFSSKGFSKAAILGIMANMSAESGFKTDALGDGGTSYGLCQWHNTRWDDLKAFCAQNNYDSSSVEGQVEFFLHELSRKGYSDLRHRIETAQTLADAQDVAYQMCLHFERPAGGEASAQGRANKVSGFWEQYKNV